MESEIAEVVPLFGDRKTAGEEPRIEVKVRSVEWSHQERMRLASILFGPLLERLGEDPDDLLNAA